jgi:cytochrome c-type biogenesis protein CcmH/NrfG
MRRLVFAMLFSLVSLPSLAVVSLQMPDIDVTLHNVLYDKGTMLIKPYLSLSDQPVPDASSPEAREKLFEGIDLLKQVVGINPNNAPAYWIMGMAYRALESDKDATIAFGTAYQINPMQRDFAREYSYSCMCSGQTSLAVKIAERVSAQYPTDAGLMANVGLALLADGQLDQAQETTQKAMMLDPADDVTQSLMKEIEAVKNGKKAARYCH